MAKAKNSGGLWGGLVRVTDNLYRVFSPQQYQERMYYRRSIQMSTGGLASEHTNYVAPVAGNELHPDVDIIPDSPAQRRRCTLAYHNNTLVKGIVESQVRQAIGNLKVQARTPSAQANQIIEGEWKRRLENGLLETIKCSARHMLIDGGTLIRPLGRASDPLDFEVVPYRRVRTPYGVVENAEYPKWDEVRDGFQRDKSGNIIGFYILEEESAYDAIYPVGRYEREKLFAHPTLPRLSGQSKGLCWYGAAITKLEMVSRWMNALLKSQEVHAYVVALVRTPNRDARPIAGVNTVNDPTNTKALQAFANQHRFLFLPDMADFKLIQANAPIIADFLMWNLRMVARSLGVSYERLTYDLSKTSFSSTKFGDRDDLATVHEHQKILELDELRQLNRRLVAGLYLRPDLKMPGAGQFAKDPDSIMEAIHFQFPGRPPVDELKAENANKLALSNRTACRSDICASRGADAVRIQEKLTEEDAAFLKGRKQMWIDHGFDDQAAMMRAADELAADKSKTGAITPGNAQEDIAEGNGEEESGKADDKETEAKVAA